MVLEWVQKNQKLAAKITGVNFLLMTLVMLFWAQPKTGLSDEEKAAANVARMEARVSGSNKQVSGKSNLDIMKEHRQKQQQQLRITLIIMSMCGAGFLAYGFLKKEN